MRYDSPVVIDQENTSRERIIAERTGAANPFSDSEIRTVFEALMNGVAAPAR